MYTGVISSYGMIPMYFSPIIVATGDKSSERHTRCTEKKTECKLEFIKKYRRR